MQALKAQRDAEMTKRGDATKTFYAALTPEQKKVFDAEALRMGPFGRNGGHHGGMGYGHGMGMDDVRHRVKALAWDPRATDLTLGRRAPSPCLRQGLDADQAHCGAGPVASACRVPARTSRLWPCPPCELSRWVSPWSGLRWHGATWRCRWLSFAHGAVLACSARSFPRCPRSFLVAGRCLFGVFGDGARCWPPACCPQPVAPWNAANRPSRSSGSHVDHLAHAGRVRTRWATGAGAFGLLLALAGTGWVLTSAALITLLAP